MLDTTGSRRNALTGMRQAVRLLAICGLLLVPGVVLAQGNFDGNWLTTVTCPPKGSTEGYTMHLPGVVKDNNFRGEHGTASEPGYLLIEGKIAADGAAKLSATGKVSSRKYGTGVFTTEGTDYSYGIKAQFKETEGTGIRDKGLGIVGRPCTFEFARQ